MDIYNKIHDFCQVRNLGSCYKNGTEPTPRVVFIMNLLNELGIDYDLDVYKGKYDSPDSDNNMFNIIMKGTSNRMITAHHDVNNINSENANDNSCSVINAIALKTLMPEIHVVLLDGEEFGGHGSQRCSEQINSNYFGEIEWVLNLELTGVGGDKFFIGRNGKGINNHILELFDCPVISTPYNDSITFNRNGIDSTVINPCPSTEVNDEYFMEKLVSALNMHGMGLDELTEDEAVDVLVDIKENEELLFDGKYVLETSHLMLCHSMEDNLEKISTEDMKQFVENVLVKILKHKA